MGGHLSVLTLVLFITRGFAKKGCTPLFRRQNGAHLKNEKMRQQSHQEDQNEARHEGRLLGFNERCTVLALTLV